MDAREIRVTEFVSNNGLGETTNLGTYESTSRFIHGTAVGQNRRTQIQRRIASVSRTALLNLIDRVRRLDYETASFDQVRGRVYKLLDYYLIAPKELIYHGVWRGRKGPPGRFFHNVSELWYPPTAKVLTYGRLNLPNQSVFYCAMQQRTAAIEVRPAVGEWVTTLYSENKRGFAANSMISMGMHRCNEPVIETLQLSHVGNTPELQMMLGTLANLKKWLLIDRLFADLLTTPVPDGQEAKHMSTVAIANALACLPRVAGFMYPSVGSHLNDFNLCLSTAAADKYLRPIHAVIHEVTRYLPAPRVIEARRLWETSSINADGTIRWRHASPLASSNSRPQSTSFSLDSQTA